MIHKVTDLEIKYIKNNQNCPIKMISGNNDNYANICAFRQWFRFISVRYPEYK